MSGNSHTSRRHGSKFFSLFYWLRRHGLRPGLGLGLLTSLAFFAPLMYHLATSGYAPRETEAPFRVCRDSLGQISRAYRSWLLMHDGQMPPSLEILHPEYLLDATYLICPEAPLSELAADDVPVSYAYVGPLDSSLAQAQVIIVYDRPGNHEEGRGVVFADGHVWFVYEEDLAARLQESLARVKSVRWDDYPEQRQREIEAFYTVGDAPTSAADEVEGVVGP